jgi:hypothetical protein
LHECPRSLKVEQLFQAPHEVGWKRSGKWGPYERGHCLVNERRLSETTCIDGTFSSQPFLHSLPFHGGIGFGSGLNSGANYSHNNVCLKWRWDPDFYGPGIGEWVATLWTTRFVKKGEEFMWSYPPSSGYEYAEFDPLARPFQFFGSAFNNALIPNVPAAKTRQPITATPATAQKQKTAKKDPPPFIAPDASLSYGTGVAVFNENDDDNSDSGESESSVSSSDDEQFQGVRGIQPVFPEIVVPVCLKARKLEINWQVRNEIASNIAVGARLQ